MPCTKSKMLYAELRIMPSSLWSSPLCSVKLRDPLGIIMSLQQREPEGPWSTLHSELRTASPAICRRAVETDPAEWLAGHAPPAPPASRRDRPGDRLRCSGGSHARATARPCGCRRWPRACAWHSYVEARAASLAFSAARAASEQRPRHVVPVERRSRRGSSVRRRG